MGITGYNHMEQAPIIHHKDLLLREMSHRVKNSFTLSQSIVSLSARDATTVPELCELVQARLQSLANAHNLLLSNEASETSFMTLARSVLGHFDGRILLSGDDFLITDKSSITSFALLLHEFGTNASKYGALSGDGHVTLVCEREEDCYNITWKEHNGPHIEGAPKNGNGFGTTLFKAAELQLGADIIHHWNPEGLMISVIIPI